MQYDNLLYVLHYRERKLCITVSTNSSLKNIVHMLRKRRNKKGRNNSAEFLSSSKYSPFYTVIRLCAVFQCARMYSSMLKFCDDDGSSSHPVASAPARASIRGVATRDALPALPSFSSLAARVRCVRSSRRATHTHTRARVATLLLYTYVVSSFLPISSTFNSSSRVS